MLIGKLETMLILLGIVAVLAVIATKIRFPFPIMMVLGGVIIALIPGLPVVSMDPDLVLIVFLPPILYSAAFSFPWEEFRSNLRPILMMAIGLVLATVVCVALAAHWLIPGMTLALGFVLGAIVSPPDAVAATAVFHRLRVPQRMITVIEGESLVNDASGLVAYAMAVAAVMTGTFSLPHAAMEFVWVSAGGVGFGLLVAWIAAKAHRRLDDPATGITLEILTPYIAYLPAERLGVSGVLAAVAAGLYVGNHASRILNAATRIAGTAIWGFINFFLNGVIFILIGLEFPVIMKRLAGTPVWHLAGFAVAISAVVIGVRFGWIYAASALAERFLPPLQAGFRPNRGALFVVGWAGMRGAVSLAAALALPVALHTGEEFPQRNLIIFLTYCVIFVTLVLQGFTLPLVVRKAGVEETESEQAQERRTRMILMREAVEAIDQETARQESGLSAATLKILREHFAARLNHLSFHQDQDRAGVRDYEREVRFVISLMDRSRSRLADLLNRGEINDAVRRRVEYDLDNEEQRLSRILNQARA